MELQRFDPATDAEPVRACHEIHLACAPLDEPELPPQSYQSFAGWMVYGWTEDPSQAWLARDGTGEACGWCVLTLYERENRDAAHLDLQVRPASRRRGLGTALVEHAAGQARKSGRRLLLGESAQGSAGEGFALALGAERGLTEVLRVLRLASLPAGRVASLRAGAEAAAGAYSLVTWEGPTPDDRLATVASVYSAIADAPHEPGQEPQIWDAERVRQDSVRMAAQGLRVHTVAAQQAATGELAAFTQLGVDPADPEWGWQEITVVARPHRGHRLGMLIKTAMLELLASQEPQLTSIVTGNADGNEHMIAINEALGFEVLNRWPAWKLDLGSRS